MPIRNVLAPAALLLTSYALPCAAFAETAPPPAPGFDVAAAKHQIDAVLDKDYPQLDALYKDIHQHAELGFQENRTAGLLSARMRALGFEVTEHVGKTGIVAIYKNGAGPTVMIRTEMDALPMEEKTGLPYASRNQQTADGRLTFTDHSCGHDSHMAWWVGTAEALVAMKDQWHGTLMFIGQPAEEIVGGAHAMIADGVFKRFPKPDYGFAAHVGPAPAGTVQIKEGAVTSASDSLDIVFHGQGAHGSMPDKSIDPVTMGARFVTDVQTVVSREKEPGTFGVITVGSFQAGTVDNIIPDQSEVKLSLRSHDPETRKLLLTGVDRFAKAAAEEGRATVPPTITYLHGTAAVQNDPDLTPRVAAVEEAALGNRVLHAPAYAAPGTASEDYSEFIEAGVPSTFFGIGGADPAKIAEAKAEHRQIPVNHSPLFAPLPEPAIRTGTEVLTLAVLTVAHR